MVTLRVAFTVSILLLPPTVGWADTVVVPNAQTNAAGNANTGGVGNYAGSIDQTLYSASQFPSAIDITGISYRAAPGTGSVTATWGSLDLYLSYSPNSPNSTDGTLMSTTFANNIGMDQTLVFSGTNITLSAPGCSGPGPCPFAAGLTFTTPFYYDPSAGNLLLESIATNTGGSGGSLDVEGFLAPGGTLAIVLNDTSDSATTGTLSYAGIITQFTYTPATVAPVPEPAPWLLTASAVAIACLWNAKRRRPILPA